MHSDTERITKLTLGTVQIGQDYGLANTTGMPDDDAASAVLDAAWAGGIHAFDTARLYGLAERRIGTWMSSRGHRPFIVTKSTKMEADADPDRSVRESVAQSKAALGIDRLDLLMLHRAGDILLPGVAEVLETLKTEGHIGGFGVSAYAPEDVDRALLNPGISAVQVPFNLFDRRFERTGILQQCADRGVTAFTRSLFLQGLFFMPPHTLPDFLSQAAPALRELHALSRDIGRSVAEIALVAVRDTPGVASIVVGAEKDAQIRETLSFASAPPLRPEEREKAFDICADMPEHVYLPNLWRKAGA